MKASKGFTNRAKGGDKALPARWRQAAAKGKLERGSRRTTTPGPRTKKRS